MGEGVLPCSDCSLFVYEVIYVKQWTEKYNVLEIDVLDKVIFICAVGGNNIGAVQSKDLCSKCTGFGVSFYSLLELSGSGTLTNYLKETLNKP